MGYNYLVVHLWNASVGYNASLQVSVIIAQEKRQ